MTSESTLLCYPEPTPSDLRLAQLSEFLGVTCSIAGGGLGLERVADHSLCILTSARTIAHLSNEAHGSRTFINSLTQKSRFLFVYGFCPTQLESSVARRLTNAAISHVSALDRTGLKYRVSSSLPTITREFTGLSVGPVRAATDFTFVPSVSCKQLSPLISIGALPFAVFFQKDGCAMFLVACNDIVALNQKVERTHNVIDNFSCLVPASMFLKYAFRQHCWHTQQRLANIIIDDPLLRRSYGFLNYADLIAAMDQCRCAATIAFIPWNYKRTHPSVAHLFRQRSDRLSICVHGCDHTQAEFASSDMRYLNTKVRLASHRMGSHHAATGVGWSKVMVFPQARFSTQALKVLKLNNYLAAVNSTPFPITSNGQYVLTLADFLKPAMTKYHQFPLFYRRYPGRIEECAWDLFFDKPLLLVEHHSYFKDGYNGLVEFVSNLNSVAGGLEWRGLQEIVTRTHLERDTSENTTVCQLYSNCHVIKNERETDRKYIIRQGYDNESPLDQLLLDDRITQFGIHDNVLELALNVPANQAVTVRSVYENSLACDSDRNGLVRVARVWARRMLCELRDNMFRRNELLFAGAHALRRRFVPRRGGAS